MGIVTFIAVRFAEVAVVVLLIVFLPNIPPNSNFTHFKVTPPLNLEGKLAINERLNNAERLFENELKGPESFAIYNGELYTTIHGGDVVKLSGGHIIPIAKFGKPCTGHIEESACGRPLGLVFHKNGALYVSDAYMGIWRVDVKSGKKTLLVSMDEEIEGKKVTLPNSLVVADNGDIYWTESSTEFVLEDGVYTFLSDPSGRLIHYNSQTKRNRVLLNGFHFANGLILSDNEDYLLIAETAQSRIMRYYLKGSKKGQHDIFLDGLPGLPDNLQPDGKGGLFSPLVVARDADHPLIFQIFGPFPYVRKFFARIIGISHMGFKTIHKVYPNIYTQQIVHWIGHLEPLTVLAPGRTTVLHISKDGEILDVLHGSDKSVMFVSDAIVYRDHLYLGSPYNTYLARVSLEKAGLKHLSQSAPKTAAPAKKAAPPTAKPTPQPATTQAPVKQSPSQPKQADAPKPTPVRQAPPTAAPQAKQTPPPAPRTSQQPAKQAPPPAAAPAKQAPPPAAAPAKQAPPPAAAPIKQAPPPAEAPAKQAPPPSAAPVKQAPPPAAAPVKQAPPPAAAQPAKQAPPPAAAPAKQAPPAAAAPAKQAPPPAATQPVKQAPPPAAAPVKQTAPSAGAGLPKQTEEPTKQSPPPVKEIPKQPPAAAAAPVQQTPPPAASTKKPSAQPTKTESATSKTKESDKEGPKVVPVKENARPKSESIQPRK